MDQGDPQIGTPTVLRNVLDLARKVEGRSKCFSCEQGPHRPSFSGFDVALSGDATEQAGLHVDYNKCKVAGVTYVFLGLPEKSPGTISDDVNEWKTQVATIWIPKLHSERQHMRAVLKSSKPVSEANKKRMPGVLKIWSKHATEMAKRVSSITPHGKDTDPKFVLVQLADDSTIAIYPYIRKEVEVGDMSKGYAQDPTMEDGYSQSMPTYLFAEDVPFGAYHEAQNQGMQTREDE